MGPMYYIGLDVHKQKISYCVKESGGKIYAEGWIPATRHDLDCWMKNLPQPWSAALEATMFSGWIYDHLKPHAAAMKVAHPLMLRAIAAAKKIGPITALTWALEIGEVQRFSSIKKAISYCGLCGDEQRSANSVQRTPISKQRNKHLQTTLIEAAKMAPRYSPTLAMLYDREKQKGNANRATLAVARKLIAYLMAVDRGQTHFLVVDREACTAA